MHYTGRSTPLAQMPLPSKRLTVRVVLACRLYVAASALTSLPSMCTRRLVLPLAARICHLVGLRVDDTDADDDALGDTLEAHVTADPDDTFRNARSFVAWIYTGPSVCDGYWAAACYCVGQPVDWAAAFLMLAHKPP